MPGIESGTIRVDTVPSHERIHPYDEHIGLQTRLLVSGQALNPDKKDLHPVTEDVLGDYLDEYHSNPLIVASTQERTDYWKDKEGNDYEKQKAKWVKDLVGIFQTSKDFFKNSEQGKRWSDLYSRLGIDTQNATASAMETLYSKYFVEGKQSNIRQFIANTVEVYKKADGTIDYDKLKQNLDGIEWISNIFGATSSEIVAQLVDAEVKLQTQAKTIVTKANEEQTVGKDKVLRLNNLNDTEKRLLKFLWRGGLVETAPPDTEYPPEDPFRRPDITPRKREDLINRYKIELHRTDRGKNGNGQPVKEFPDYLNVSNLTDPKEIAKALKRQDPIRYGRSDEARLEQIIKQEKTIFQEQMNRIGLTPQYLENLIMQNLTDYEKFLEKQYGIAIPDIKHMQVVPIYGKTSELWNPGQFALAMVRPRYPVIFLDFDVIRQQAYYMGMRQFGQMNVEDFNKVITQLLWEIQPHEYTHLMADIANWHLLKQEGDHWKTTDIGPSKLGLFLLKPTPPKINAQDMLILKERGRGLMEAITVELTQQWKITRSDKPLKHQPYVAERQVLHALVDQLAKERNMSRDEVFKKFVNAYFKSDGLKDLIFFMSGRKVQELPEVFTIKKKDGTTEEKHKVRITYDENRRHFTEIIYALMEYDTLKSRRNGLPPGYPLAIRYIQGNLSIVEKIELSRYLDTYDRKRSQVQLSQKAVEEMRKVLQAQIPETVAA